MQTNLTTSLLSHHWQIVSPKHWSLLTYDLANSDDWKTAWCFEQEQGETAGKVEQQVDEAGNSVVLLDTWQLEGTSNNS